MGKFKEINKPQSMRETQIMAYLSALSTIIHLDKDKAIDIANGLESLSDEEVIKRLAEFTYENIKNDFELLDYYLDLLMNINPNAIKSVDALKKDLIQEYQNQHSDDDVKDNHALISSTLRQMADLLNKEAIDYIAVGTIPCFLQKGIPLYRYHDNLSFMINEDNIEAVKKIVEESGYTFIDYRFPSFDEFRSISENKPPYMIMAQSPYNDFYIGFSTFRGKRDERITTTEYLPREMDGEVIVDRIDRIYNQEGTNLRFNEEFSYKGVKIKSCSVEHVYDQLMQANRQNDIVDAERLEPYLDYEKLKNLRRNTNNRTIEKDIGYYEYQRAA